MLDVTCNGKIMLIEPSPTAQHIVVVPQNGDPQLWHVMSNSLVHTFKGHSGPVHCLSIIKNYLLTGSADTSTIVWDLKSFEMKFKIQEHIAPVICVTSALNSTYMVSGGEDSRIIVSSLITNKIVMKIDHHRGPVTALQATNFIGDVLVSGSTDGTVCLWALDKFALLNSIVVPCSVSKLNISSDSVFLLVACDDNQLYLHTLATGTLLHAFRGHRPQVLSMCIAADNRRAVVGGVDGRVYVYDMHSGGLARTIITPHGAEVMQVKTASKDDFLITAGGNRLTYWSFRKEDGVGLEENFTIGKHSPEVKKPHTSPITCLDISRDGTLAVTGSTDSMVNVWQLNSHELHSTMEGHTATITCLAISPNGLFAISGSEDKTSKAWGLTLGLVVSTFMGHQSIVTAVGVLADSRRVVSCDKQGVIAVWIADNGSLLHTILGPTQYLAITNNMKYAVSGDGGNSLRIWPLVSHREDEKFNVSHTEEITCFVLTTDSQHLITGSQDTSLKVWQVIGGKLAQVLVGHTDTVTCVAVAITNKSLAVSGSRDSNLIVWDMDTGADLHLLVGHLGCITCVKVAGDGTLAVSGSEDKRIIVWDTKKGTILSTLQLHLPLLGLVMANDVSRVAVYLLESCYLPIICLHNTPATYVKVPVYVAPAKEIEDLRPSAPKRPMRRLLKKEVTLDTYTWQKKYAHLTSSLMMASVDERLRRRFSVSASMEEISKIPESIASQACYGPEEAALAQSQHFDQLEALWNRSPPRQRRHQQSLSKQNSRSSRQHSADDDGGPSPVEEVADYPGD